MDLKKCLLATVRPQFRRFDFHDHNPVTGRTRERVIFAPNEDMSFVHEELRKQLRELCQRHFPLPYATGMLPGSSVRKNVLRHRGHRFFYLLDLKDAYESVDMADLATVLCGIDPEVPRTLLAIGEIEEFLTRYCMGERGLAVGGPASQDLFNIYAGHRIDISLGNISQVFGLTYTRYLDDLTFSSDSIIRNHRRRAIRETILHAGFEISHQKARCVDTRKGPVNINGVNLFRNGNMKLPRRYLKKINGLIHRVTKTGDEAEYRRVRGMMGVFYQATHVPYYNRTEIKLLESFEALQNLMEGI